MPGGTAEQHSLASPDAVDFQALRQAINGVGVISGCQVVADGIDLTLTVLGGMLVTTPGSQPVPMPTGKVTCAPDGTNPSYGLILGGPSGPVLLQGTPAAALGTSSPGPVFPVPPYGSVILGAVYLNPAAAAVLQSDVVDKRCFVQPPLPPLVQTSAMQAAHLAGLVGNNQEAPVLGLIALQSWIPGSPVVFGPASTWVVCDSTNAVITFTAPASGAVFVDLCAMPFATGASLTLNTNVYWGLGSATAGVGIVSGPTLVIEGSAVTASYVTLPIYLNNLTPGQSYTYYWQSQYATTSGAPSANGYVAGVQNFMRVWGVFS